MSLTDDYITYLKVPSKSGVLEYIGTIINRFICSDT